MPCITKGAPFSDWKKSSEIKVTSAQESSLKSTMPFSILLTHPLVERTETPNTEVPASVNCFFLNQMGFSIEGGGSIISGM